MLKKLKIIGLYLFILMSVILTVNAIANYKIDKVEVNDVNVGSSGNSVFLERGQTATIDVWFSGVQNIGTSVSSNVRVRAWVGGYEFGDLSVTSDIFETEPNVSYLKTLKLDVPNDIDGSKTYTLHVEVFDEVESVENVYSLRIQEKRHSVEIMDVLFNPDLTVEAGKNLFSTVRIKNIGDRKEEDIKVTLSVPKLGISTRTYIDELVSQEVANSNEEDSASSNELYLKIPENTNAGNYDVKVTVEFNNGHDVTEKTFTLTVLGTEKPSVSTSLINVDTSTRQLMQGEGTIYKLSFANLETKSRTYTLEVFGTETWATSRVDPAVVTVNPDSTSEAYVYLSPSEDASTGLHMFTIKVKSDNTVVKEINLGAEVTEATKKIGVWDSLKKALMVIFLVLLGVLVLLGIVVGVKRLRKSETEEPGVGEGQTYYYYPNQ